MYIDLFSINILVTPHHRLVLVAGLTKIVLDLKLFQVID